jgi:hypothetical protein
MNLLTRFRNAKTSTRVMITIAVLLGINYLCYLLFGDCLWWDKAIKISITISTKGSM